MKQKKLSILIIGIVGILIISGLSTAIIKTEDKNSVSIDNISAKGANGVPAVGNADELVLYVDDTAVSLDEYAPSPEIGEAKEFKVDVLNKDGASVEADIRFCKGADGCDTCAGSSTAYFTAPFISSSESYRRCELHATACDYASFTGYIYVTDRPLSLEITEPVSALEVVEGKNFTVSFIDQDGEVPPGGAIVRLYNDIQSYEKIIYGTGEIEAPEVEKDEDFSLKVWKDEGEYDEGEGPSITVLDNYLNMAVYRADDYQEDPDNAESITEINERERFTVVITDRAGDLPDVSIYFGGALQKWRKNPATWTTPYVDEDTTYDIETHNDVGMNTTLTVLNAVCTVNGTVVNESSGEAIMDARVSYTSLLGGSDSTETNDNGEFLFSDVKLGLSYDWEYTFEASASGYITKTITQKIKEDIEINFELEPTVPKRDMVIYSPKDVVEETEFTVTVSDSETGNEVQDVTITFKTIPRQVEYGSPATFTAPTIIGDTPSREFTITATAEGYNEEETNITVTNLPAPIYCLTIELKDTAGNPISSGGSIDEGEKFIATVIDSKTGGNAQGITMTFKTNPPKVTFKNPKEFEAPYVEGNHTYEIIAKKLGYTEGTARIKVIDKGQEACVIFGIVKDKETNQGINGAKVSSLFHGSITTGKDGRYELALEPGIHLITVSAQGYKAQSRTITLSVKEEKEENFDLECKPRIIYGRVINGNFPFGGISSAKVETDDGAYSTSTGVLGYFTLELSSECDGTVTLKASKEGWNDGEGSVPCGDTWCTIVLYEEEGEEEPPLTCFLAGTQIVMANGNTQPIETIKEGDEVKSVDTNTGEIGTGKVSKTFVHSPEEMIGDYYLVIDGELKVTKEHPFYIKRDDGAEKFVEAAELKVGDIFGGKQIQSIEKVYVELENRPTTYNFEVDGTHTYIVAYGNNEGLVHNENDETQGVALVISGDKNDPIDIDTDPIKKDMDPVIKDIYPIIKDMDPVIKDTDPLVIDTDPVIIDTDTNPIITEQTTTVLDLTTMELNTQPAPTNVPSQPEVIEQAPTVVETITVLTPQPTTVAQTEPDQVSSDSDTISTTYIRMKTLSNR